MDNIKAAHIAQKLKQALVRMVIPRFCRFWRNPAPLMQLRVSSGAADQSFSLQAEVVQEVSAAVHPPRRDEARRLLRLARKRLPA